MARLRIRDGYTLSATTRPDFGDHKGLPVVAFEFRPALPEALYDWQYAYGFAAGGKEKLAATVKLLVDHLTQWDVEGEGGGVAPITPEAVRAVPDPILSQLFDAVSKWKPRDWSDDLGNSPSQPG